MALQLGYAHPDILLAQLSSSQLTEWMVYAAIEPFGEIRSELRHGQMMHAFDAANFKRDKPLKVVDFMNFVERPDGEKLTPEEIQERIDREVFKL